jgi:hypothetical protein
MFVCLLMMATKWPKHVRQKDFTYLIITFFRLDEYMLFI